MKIVELGRHKPSVESVIERLDRYKDEIEHITVVVTWKDKSANTYGDDKKISEWCYHSRILDMCVDEMIEE